MFRTDGVRHHLPGICQGERSAGYRYMPVRNHLLQRGVYERKHLALSPNR